MLGEWGCEGQQSTSTTVEESFENKLNQTAKPSTVTNTVSHVIGFYQVKSRSGENFSCYSSSFSPAVNKPFIPFYLLPVKPTVFEQGCLSQQLVWSTCRWNTGVSRTLSLVIIWLWVSNIWLVSQSKAKSLLYVQIWPSAGIKGLWEMICVSCALNMRLCLIGSDAIAHVNLEVK